MIVNAQSIIWRIKRFRLVIYLLLNPPGPFTILVTFYNMIDQMKLPLFWPLFINFFVVSIFVWNY